MLQMTLYRYRICGAGCTVSKSVILMGNKARESAPGCGSMVASRETSEGNPRPSQIRDHCLHHRDTSRCQAEDHPRRENHSYISPRAHCGSEKCCYSCKWGGSSVSTRKRHKFDINRKFAVEGGSNQCREDLFEGLRRKALNPKGPDQ